MARVVGMGLQSFEKIVERDCFYIDKTGFIKASGNLSGDFSELRQCERKIFSKARKIWMP